MTREERVLGWVNRQRKKHELGGPLDSLPAGPESNIWRCPVAKALTSADVSGLMVDTCSTEFELHGHEVKILHPVYVQRFILAVDEGRYPHLTEVIA